MRCDAMRCDGIMRWPIKIRYLLVVIMTSSKRRHHDIIKGDNQPRRLLGRREERRRGLRRIRRCERIPECTLLRLIKSGSMMLSSLLLLQLSFTRKKKSCCILWSNSSSTIILQRQQQQQQQAVRWMMAGGKRPKKMAEMNAFLKRVAPTVKMRHVQKFCHQWFSADHLRSDFKLRSHIQSNHGWCQFKLLLNRSKFRDWTNETLLQNAFRTARPPGTFEMKKENGQMLVRLFNVQEQLAACKSLPGPQPPQLDFYDMGDREVVVVADHHNRGVDDTAATAAVLKETCQRLSQANCLGMDVEFAPLKLLPRHHRRGDDDDDDNDDDDDDDDDTCTSSRPPAMIKLASDDLVALIWLHNFPNHGKSAWKGDDSANKSTYKPLWELLASDKILKVGVGLPKKARQLAFFWGMTSRSDAIRLQRKAVTENFKQLIDLRENKYAEGSNLYLLCSRILGLKLPRKHNLHSSLYRSDRMLPKLKVFTAREAACLLDIWRAIQEKKAQLEQQNKRSSSRRSRARRQAFSSGGMSWWNSRL